MTAHSAQQTATSTNLPDQLPLVPAASNVSLTAYPYESCSCVKPGCVMLCEVYSYRKGMHDDGMPQLAYTGERCEVCPFGGAND